MEVLVVVEDRPEHSTVLALVNSVPSPLNSERPSRDVVTLYGDPTAESLALALAAAIEMRREHAERSDTIRHVSIWPERGAVGDAAWRDEILGSLVTRDLVIPMDVLYSGAEQLLSDAESEIQQLVAGLTMPDWPEATRRAISFRLTTAAVTPVGVHAPDNLLDTYRQADGLEIDIDGD